MDRYLDTARHGPMFLLRPEIASLVVQAFRRGTEMGFYDLRAFVVMANHVHILFRPHQTTTRVLQWLKGATARDANRLLARTGKPFWQRESYDRWIRTDEQLERTVTYIENNPVKAGLATEAFLYRWSSAWSKTKR
jgi:REP element-mobilizing transposase RayT